MTPFGAPLLLAPNLSSANAQRFFDHFGSGDPVAVKSPVGSYNHYDGAQDWQM